MKMPSFRISWNQMGSLTPHRPTIGVAGSGNALRGMTCRDCKLQCEANHDGDPGAISQCMRTVCACACDYACTDRLTLH
jgi:hypothetical protein